MVTDIVSMLVIHIGDLMFSNYSLHSCDHASENSWVFQGNHLKV